MFRRLVAATILATLSAASPAKAQDIAGTWRIASSSTPEGGSYGGTVTIRHHGACYDVEWLLDSGDRYTGVGLTARNTVFAVAYSDAPGADYGVVYYAPNRTTGGFEGWWCTGDGESGIENLSGTTLTGSHRLTSRNDGATLMIEPYGGGSVNYDLSWSGGIKGFGTSLGEDGGMVVALWGNLESGGVALYSMVRLSQGSLPGWWAPVGMPGQGREILER